MSDLVLSHYFSWQGLPDQCIGSVMAEFAANGAQNLVLVDKWLERMLTDRRFSAQLDRLARRHGLKFTDAHGPYGPCFDLDCSEISHRKTLLADHELAMQIAADLGAKCYVVHIGAWDCLFRPEISLQKMRDLADESLEKLIEIADRIGMVIAVENAFELSNAPDEVIRLMKKFAHPALGACFDSGHANYMLPLPDGSCKAYSDHQLRAWRGKPMPEPRPLEKMLPYIVTCHLHDNYGLGDDHNLPGRGTINWPQWMGQLKSAPRLMSIQSEVETGRYEISVRELCETMNKLMAY